MGELQSKARTRNRQSCGLFFGLGSRWRRNGSGCVGEEKLLANVKMDE